MMRDEIFTFDESFIKLWGDLIGMGSLEDHKKGFGALQPQFVEG